jgi:hypothetical protein
MATLYYTTSSCGAASFIAAVTAGLHLKADQVAFATHTTNSGADFYQINPKGNVPCIVLEDGTVLNEGAATLQYIADQVYIIYIYDLLGLIICTLMLFSLQETIELTLQIYYENVLLILGTGNRCRCLWHKREIPDPEPPELHCQ